MINSIKEYFFKFCLFISSSSKEQNDLQKKIDKAAALKFDASVEYISNNAKNRFQLSKRIALLQKQVGFFDQIFLKDRIATLIQTAEELRTTLQENKKRSINGLEILENTIEDFSKISTDLFTYELDLPPPAIAIESIEEAKNEISEEEVLPKAPFEISEKPASHEEPQGAVLTSGISPAEEPGEPIPVPIVKPEKAVFELLVVPGVLSHPYRLIQAFVQLPNFQYYKDRLIRFIQSYKYSSTTEKDFQENTDWVLKVWENLVTKSPEFYEARTYALSEYVNAPGAQYYILKIIDSINAFIENYSSFPLFSQEGRKQFCAVDVEKIAEYVFNNQLSDTSLNPSELFIVQLGKGFLSLVDDLFQKCKQNTYWKKWAIAFTRGPWDYLSTQALVNVLKDPLLLKGTLKQLLLEFASREGYLKDITDEGHDAYKKTKNLSGKTASKDEREFKEACTIYSAIASDEGQSFFKQAEYYYDMYIARFIGKSIDVHDISYLSDFVTKILKAVPSFRAALESTHEQKQFQQYLKDIFVSGIKVLQNFMRESERVPLEKLVWESLDRTLTSFRFKAGDLNYLQQYWEGIALPWLQDIADRVKDYPKDWDFFPKDIPYNKDFLNEQTIPGYMRNNATLFHYFDTHSNVNEIIDKLSGLVGKYVRKSPNDFKNLFKNLRNFWHIYREHVYGTLQTLQTLPNFTAKAFSPAERISNRDTSNQRIRGLYTLEIFYRAYKELSFLSKDNLKAFTELNAECFVDNLFNAKELADNASAFEKQLFHPLKDFIFWIEFRVVENRKEPGWIGYEVSRFESNFKAWLNIFGGSFALKTFLLAKTFEKTAKGAFKVVKSFLKKQLYNLSYVKKERHLKKKTHQERPELALKKYESKIGRTFNDILDDFKEEIFSPIFSQWLGNHSISSLMECMSTWIDAFEKYPDFVRTGNQPEFNKVIRNTLVMTIKTLQNYVRETQKNDVESAVVQCLHECLQEYKPATSFNFQENHFQQITSAFWQKLLAII